MHTPPTHSPPAPGPPVHTSPAWDTDRALLQALVERHGMDMPMDLLLTVVAVLGELTDPLTLPTRPPVPPSELQQVPALVAGVAVRLRELVAATPRDAGPRPLDDALVAALAASRLTGALAGQPT